jgi:hypothetical protein
VSLHDPDLRSPGTLLFYILIQPGIPLVILNLPGIFIYTDMFTIDVRKKMVNGFLEGIIEKEIYLKKRMN